MITQLEAQYTAQFPGWNVVPSQDRAFPATRYNHPAQCVRATATVPAQNNQPCHRTIISSNPKMDIQSPDPEIERLLYVINWQKKEILRLRGWGKKLYLRCIDLEKLCKVYGNNIEVLLRELADLKRPKVPTIEVTEYQESYVPHIFQGGWTGPDPQQAA
ncbi:MAG: hypothetical protein Q9173_000235 [Seirophora scorigena]